jgi:hypothetical protein
MMLLDIVWQVKRAVDFAAGFGISQHELGGAPSVFDRMAVGDLEKARRAVGMRLMMAFDDRGHAGLSLSSHLARLARAIKPIIHH